jgi:hypothetical protein
MGSMDVLKTFDICYIYLGKGHHISLTYFLRPLIPVRENSEVVMKFPQIYVLVLEQSWEMRKNMEK